MRINLRLLGVVFVVEFFALAFFFGLAAGWEFSKRHALRPVALSSAPGVSARELQEHPRVMFRPRAMDDLPLMVGVNGTTMRFIVDTGAVHVMLNRRDAERAGVVPKEGDFTLTYKNYNGTIEKAARVSIRVAVEDVVLDDVVAAVYESYNERDNLLGMSFVSRLRTFTVGYGTFTFEK